MIFLAMAVVMLVLPRMLRRNISVDNITQAKERAAERARANAYADTQPIHDPYRTGLDLTSAMSATEIDERAIGHSDLTDEQKEVISLIFDGFPATMEGSRKKLSGTSGNLDDIWGTRP